MCSPGFLWENSGLPALRGHDAACEMADAWNVRLGWERTKIILHLGVNGDRSGPTLQPFLPRRWQPDLQCRASWSIDAEGRKDQLTGTISTPRRSFRQSRVRWRREPFRSPAELQNLSMPAAQAPFTYAGDVLCLVALVVGIRLGLRYRSVVPVALLVGGGLFVL